MNVWLITWELMGCTNSNIDPLVAILNGRLGKPAIKDFLETIYMHHMGMAQEIIAWLKPGNANPFPYPPEDSGQKIICGHNPFLCARIVTGFSVKQGGNDTEILEWREPDVFRVTNDHQIQVITQGDKVKLTRQANQLWCLDKQIQ